MGSYLFVYFVDAMVGLEAVFAALKKKIIIR